MNISRSITFILGFLFATSASAQGFFKLYSPANSEARDVVQTDDGGYFMAGYVEYDSLLFLQRVDATGQLTWANHLNFNHARAIAACKADDGGFVVLTEYYADTNGLKNAVIKLNASGSVIWSKVISNNHLPNGLRDIVTTADGGFLLAGDTRDANLNFKNWLVKLNSDGSIAWEKTYGTAFLNSNRIIALSNGNYAISGGRNGGHLSITAVTPSGDFIWANTYGTPAYDRAYDFIATTDGGLAILATTQNTQQGRLEVYVVKTDNNGNELWSNSFFPYALPDQYYFLPEINCFAQDPSGNYYIPLSDGAAGMELVKLNPTGNVLWKRDLLIPGNPWAIIRTTDNLFALAGKSNSNALLFKFDSDGEVFVNKIQGTVFRDSDADCTQGSGEAGLPNFIVEAHGQGGELFFKKANADGSYELRVPEGNFELFAKPIYGPPGFYVVCDTLLVSVVGTNQVIEDQMIGMEALAECPMLEIEIGEGILRRCMNTDYTVSVCNYGNITAENASFQVTADTALSYVSSSIPLTSQNGNVYTFNIPDLLPGECDYYHVYFKVSCNTNVGEVICAEAHAYPDTTCVPPDEAWDGSEIEVTGKCENDIISFKIKNNGNAPMSQALDYVIIEDHIMYMQGHIQLGPGLDTTFQIANPGGACYLGKVLNLDNDVTIVSKPTAVVENCISGGNLALALQFEIDANNAAISTTCGDVVGSFDPNDKRGFPLGWEDNHLLERNQDIEYMVRFQNTGNDTAFLVIIRDTLQVATLDPASLRPVAASHDFTWDITEKGIVTFTFANILLPDSTTNEPASHGFVRFHVRQQPDLADGTRIENSAAIYFDFNEPVITNEYFHTVGRPIVLVTNNTGDTQLLDFQIQPNPFSSEATFVLNDYSPKNDVRFRLVDAFGKVVREESFSGNTFLFSAKNLPTGIYFFRMEENGVLLTTGKVAISK